MISNEAYNAVAALDLDQIKFKLMHVESGEGWSQEKVNAVEVEYRRFLYLMKVYPDVPTAPLVEVDIFWHYHILDTMKYAQDCEQAFGYFVHHYPYLGMDGSAEDDAARTDGVDSMRNLYESTFEVAYASNAAAFCTKAVEAESAFCTKAVEAESAFCTKAVEAESAFCTKGVEPKSAFCTKAAEAKSAFCTKAVEPKSAFCTKAVEAKSAFCTKAVEAKSVFCTKAVEPKSAFCTKAIEPKSAFCTKAVDTGAPSLASVREIIRSAAKSAAVPA